MNTVKPELPPLASEIDRLREQNATLIDALRYLTIPADDVCQWVTALVNPSEAVSDDDKVRAAACVLNARAHIDAARAALAKARSCA